MLIVAHDVRGQGGINVRGRIHQSMSEQHVSLQHLFCLFLPVLVDFRIWPWPTMSCNSLTSECSWQLGISLLCNDGPAADRLSEKQQRCCLQASCRVCTEARRSIFRLGIANHYAEAFGCKVAHDMFHKLHSPRKMPLGISHGHTC